MIHVAIVPTVSPEVGSLVARYSVRRRDSNDSSSITIEPIHATKQTLLQRESANSTEQMQNFLQ